jgi:hypothetical protein
MNNVKTLTEKFNILLSTEFYFFMIMTGIFGVHWLLLFVYVSKIRTD